MIVKLKCVSNIDDFGIETRYLTAGKVYDCIKSEFGEIALICDEGDIILDNLVECIHGKWEIVN